MFYNLNRCIDWISFRTTKRFNVLKIRSLKPSYYDKDTLMLYSMMQLLVDFVEIEMAAYKIEYMRGIKPFLYKNLPWFLRNSEWIRSREFGVKRLQEEGSFADELSNDFEKSILKQQAESAKTILKLYLWWKDIYPNRKSPEELSGVSDLFRNCKNNFDFPENFMEKRSDCFDKCFKIEEDQLQEENDMLIELIKVRKYLWT